MASRCCRVALKVRSRLLSSSNILYFKLIWIEEMQTITESRIIKRQRFIYIAGDGMNSLG
jgi:hypothetical protein